MRVALLNTGTELLFGDVRDAHLSFIAQQILPLGLRIGEQRTVPDGPAIHDALCELAGRADLLFVTGGLGPTTDDVTREAVSEFLQLELRHDEKVMETIRERLAKRGIPILESIARQAQVPAGAEVLPNENGTAPGLYLRENINPAVRSPHLFILPGPPRELQPMVRTFVKPILRNIVPQSNFARRVYSLVGIGESIVEKRVGEKVLAIGGIELGYCARPNEVDVRVVGDATAIEEADKIITAELGAFIYSADGESLEQVLVRLLKLRSETVAIAESCTGGLLSNRLTNVPGASEVFLAGYVTYANEAKVDVLGVASELIEQHGAVSGEVARAMAEGARRRANSTYGVATTGIAGPSGGSAEKPVGTVYVAVSSEAGPLAKKFFFPNDRETFKQQTAQAAFEMLRQKIRKPNIEAPNKSET